jgi:hypothetical protein
MDGRNGIQETMVRREPIAMTLADLSALVLGSALALFVPQMHFPADQITIYNAPMPGWVGWLFVIREVAMKVGLALVPVILARRARYGGLPRLADWLAILVAVALLAETLKRSGWIKRFARWYLVDFQQRLGCPVFFSPARNVHGSGVRWPTGFDPWDAYRIWGWLALVLFVLILVAVAVGWKKMPSWINTALVSAAAFTWLAGVTFVVTEGLVRAFEAIAPRIGLPPVIGVQIADGVKNLPDGLLFGVPVVAMVLEFRTRTRGKWVWSEWIGAASAVLALLAWDAVYWYADFVGRTAPLGSTRLTVRTLLLIVVGLSSWFIVEHVRSRARHRSGVQVIGCSGLRS